MYIGKNAFGGREKLKEIVRCYYLFMLGGKKNCIIMSNRKKLLERLILIKEKLDELYAGLDFRFEEKADEDVKKMIKLCNQAYPLIGFENWMFQKDFHVNFREFEHRYYIGVDGMNYFKTALSILDRVINIIKAEHEFADLLPTQKYYLKNQKLNILEDLDQIFKNAKESIFYYDLYMDHVLISTLQDVGVNEIKLLLSEPTEKFKTWLQAYVDQNGKNISYRAVKNKNIHDRYCVIDNSDVWQIGGSINNKTMNSLTITKISDEVVRDKIIDDLEKTWEQL